MNRSLVAAASIAVTLTLIASSPACAWDPDWDGRPSDRPESAAWTPQPAPVAPPEGVYLVTETYVDDVVTRSGPVTTYATETAHEVTGSYARVLESVPTGARSTYDGTAFNGRTALADGRSVAGTYYENYIRTDLGYIPVSIVFFQDDSETARAGHDTTRISRPAPEATSTPAPRSTATPSAQPRSAASPPVDAADRRPAPEQREVTVPTQPPGRLVSAPLPDRSIEVLRARRIAISFGGPGGPGVAGWRFLSGDGTALGPLSGAATDQFFVRWDRLAPLGAAWVMRFFVDLADGTTRELAIRVTVRAPGLVE